MIRLRAFALLTIFLFAAALILFLPMDYLLNYSLDDAYFYYKTALNYSKGLGSTFDGINITNGYHPLWFYSLAFYYWILGFLGISEVSTIYRLTLILASGINIASLYFLRGMLNLLFKKPAGVRVWLLISPLMAMLVMFHQIGLESHLLILFLNIYYYLVALEKKDYKSRINARAVIAGLIILSRIDLIALLLPALAVTEYLIVKMQYDKYDLRRTIIFLVIATGPFLLFFLYSLLIFGEAGTTSGAIEFIFPEIKFLENFPSPTNQPIRFGLLIFSLAPFAAYHFSLRHHSPPELKKFLFFLAPGYVGSLIFIIIHYSFNYNGAREWYYTLPLFYSLLYLMAYPVVFRRTARFVLPLVFIIQILFFAVYKRGYFDTSDAYNYALKIKKETSSRSVIFQVDYSGLIGFFSERKVINGDGLINSFEYINYLRTGKLREYFYKYPIDYYSTYSYNNAVSGGVFSDSLFTPGGYRFTFPEKNIVLTSQKAHGGFFRKRYGTFYLVKTGIPDEKL